MSNTIVTHVYKWIIENVVENVKKDFSSMGVEESILQEFQRNWELKVINTKVANFQKFSSSEDYYTQPNAYDQYNTTAAAAAPDLINQNNFPFPQFTDSYSVPPNYNVQPKIEPMNNQINSQSSNIPQTDGTNDELTTEEIDKIIEKKIVEANEEKEEEKEKGKGISQVDGEDEDEEDDLNDLFYINSSYMINNKNI
ncbi:hypothetical protein LY90DRAFT_500593 [Neocallimastix californiae]|uniref:TFIIA-domain-containing protein n=1 Tax=Neocallimastix californiae TaxID=1754190 RepID=A0A1Y2F6S1_9FUNG|nr:hypothetical protein LY90DRAFT_500593 [Neocallimastix californiae]|eukprot:ORY79583.1 hypothetical protein LY90DRAFT_500593 [Neocallimastix californiae]